MKIRKLNKTDAIEFRELRLLALQTDAQAFASLYEGEVEYPFSRFEQRLESTDSKFTYGGFRNDELVCVATFYREGVKKLQHKGNIVAMYCKEKDRGSGVSESVVKELIKEASSIERLKVIDLTVLSMNDRAIQFYKKLGFERFATEPMAIYDGKQYYDEDMMRFYL